MHYLGVFRLPYPALVAKIAFSCCARDEEKEVEEEDDKDEEEEEEEEDHHHQTRIPQEM